MRTNIDFIVERAEALAETSVIMHWVERVGPVTEDPVTGTKSGPIRNRSRIVNALAFHPVSAGTIRNVLYAELEIGDAVLALPPSEKIDSELEGVWFDVNGEKWVQKQVGEKLARALQSIVRGRVVSRSIALTKARS